MEAVDSALGLGNHWEYLRIPPDVKYVEDHSYFLRRIGGCQFKRLADGDQHRALGRVHGVEWFEAEFDAVLAGIGNQGRDSVRDHLSRFHQAHFRATTDDQHQTICP